MRLAVHRYVEERPAHLVRHGHLWKHREEPALRARGAEAATRPAIAVEARTLDLRSALHRRHPRHAELEADVGRVVDVLHVLGDAERDDHVTHAVPEPR